MARRSTTSTGSCTARTTRCAASATKIEVWVANDTAFPAGDCRAQIPNSTTITDAQVAHLITEFDTNMYPKETSAFSTPPDRDGSNASSARTPTATAASTPAAATRPSR